MTVKEYSIKKGVSVQSVYDRLKRNTLQYEVIEGVKHIVETSNKVKGLKPIDRDHVSKIEKRLNKALKKGLKHKHKALLAVNKLKSMETLLDSKQSEIDSLKSSLDLVHSMVNKKLLQIDSKSKEDKSVIDVKIKKNKKKGKKKSK